MRVLRTPDRLRPRSVRAKIVALLMLPIVSLMALWGFAAVTTASSIGDLERAKDVNSELLTPVGDFVTTVQGERTATLRYVAAPGADSLAALETARAATDKAATALLTGVDASGSDAELLNAALPGRLDRLESDAGGLSALRTEVGVEGAKPSAAFTKYSAIIEHGFSVTGALTGEETTDATSEARVVLELSRSREALAQEQALLAAGSGAGSLTTDQYALFAGAVATQRSLLKPAVADLKAAHRTAYNTVLTGGSYGKLQAVENRVRSAGPGASGVSAGLLAGWEDSVSAVLKGLAKAEAGPVPPPPRRRTRSAGPRSARPASRCSWD